MPPRTTRLAPSPTGALHLGNARTFLINWAIARQQWWKIILRIEDLDTPRVKPQARQQAIDDLSWLGLDWDEGPLYQMGDLSPYKEALDRLDGREVVYACTCTRSEITSAQSAPNLGDHEPRYSGRCWNSAQRSPHDGIDFDVQDYLNRWDQKTLAQSEPAACLRVHIPDKPITLEDMIAGPQSVQVQQEVGDFIVATKSGLPAYQLAVVVDDARQGVTDIIRGDDLIPSAGRQLWLYEYLNLTPLPRYWHLPLVIGEDGRRLAKRHGDTRLSWYRDQGVAAERIIGLMARWSGLGADAGPMSAREFAERFDVRKLERAPVVFTAKDHDWLMGGRNDE